MRWLFFYGILLLIEIYFYQSLRTIHLNRWGLMLYGIVSAAVYFFLFYQFTGARRAQFSLHTMWAIGLFISMIVPKLITIIFLLAEDIFRIATTTYRFWFGEASNFHMPSRRLVLSQLALGLTAIPFASLLYGMFKGKYNFKVLRYNLEFDDLPEAFDGYQITQISDIHSGSLDNPDKIAYAVDLINEQQSDLLLFTGDMVNNRSEELLPWMEVFGKLHAPDGMFSVLGNHDYGDYVSWDSIDDKIENLEKLIEWQRKIGFQVLQNSHRYLEREGQKIGLVGVENWGKGRFKKAGDLDKALEGIDPKVFKILMSHDPSHWDAKVLPHKDHIHLTLSGHTHGMQFGIEIPGLIKWSPVKWRYPRWAGLYHEAGRWLNVNRGFGYLAYPGRVGIWPEITVIRLKKRQNQTL